MGDMGDHRGGEGVYHPAKSKTKFSLIGGRFSLMVVFFSIWLAFFHSTGTFFPCGEPFLGLPSYKKSSAQSVMAQSGIIFYLGC